MTLCFAPNDELQVANSALLVVSEIKIARQNNGNNETT
jgi:hypothetical protein